MDTLRQIHRFSEVDEIRRVVERFGYSVFYTKITPGPLDVEAFEIRVDGCLVYREAFDCQIVAHGTSSPHGYGIMVLASGHARFFGREVSSGEVVLFPPGCAIDAIAFPEARATHFLLPGQRIAAAAADFGIDLIRLSRTLVTSPGVDRLHHLQTIRDQVDEVVDRRDPTAWPEVEEELVETFLGLFDVAARGEGWSMPPSRVGVEHAIRTRNHICSRAPEELDLDSLADDLGITRHHLNRCFREHYAVSVHAFVHLWRLHLARGRLLEDGSTTSVTEVAYACGFHHLGRFSAEYKQLFDETPSETLKRVSPQSSSLG